MKFRSLLQALFGGSDENVNSAEASRPPIWEDDISLNHDSHEPFQNIAAPSAIPVADFRSRWCWRPRFDEEIDFESVLTRDQYPMPSAADREGYNVGADVDYFLTGLQDYLELLGAATRYGVNIESYFDFGCASGRVLRHFACQSEVANIWGADINGRHIKWIDEHLPKTIKAIHTSALPYFPLADNSITLLSAFSVFTHIDTFESAWLAEIHRVLGPGGLCYLTIHNEDTWESLGNGQQEGLHARLASYVSDIDDRLAHGLPEGRSCFRYTDIGPYRALSFHSNSYIHSSWGRFFEILEIRSFSHGRHQAVVIGRKRA